MAESITGQLETGIRAYIGRFLQSRATLSRLQKSPDLKVKQEADRLMVNQLSLEKDLERAGSEVIPNIKAGTYTYTDIIWLSTFSREFISHVKKVERIGRGLPAEEGGWLASPFVWMVGASALAFAITQWQKRKR